MWMLLYPTPGQEKPGSVNMNCGLRGETASSFIQHNNTKKQTIAEESVERSDGLGQKNSSVKHSKTFHKLFQEIPVGENLTQTSACRANASSYLYPPGCNSSACVLCSQHTLVSLRHRERCYNLLQAVCSHVQQPGGSGSPHVSSPENEADPEVPSSYSSLEDCGDLSRGNSIHLDNGFPLMSSEGEKQMGQKTVLLLLASGYIGLRIIALEEQLSELSVQHRGYQQV
ncbi:hypothetical protein EYF80_011645 [Liparis tanakae]|uniref:Uncharacterized protein n=1 Tax=Liparis tanakae TaxID=230148 RepID=A0A4Z2IJE9_9TELE|nr:hypothetical protein EYF80_011645 [Liparis tanakae]